MPSSRGSSQPGDQTRLLPLLHRKADSLSLNHLEDPQTHIRGAAPPQVCRIQDSVDSLGLQKQLSPSQVGQRGPYGSQSTFICHTIAVVQSLSRVQLFATPWAIAHQAPLSLGFSQQEHSSGLPFPSPGDLPNPGIEPESLVLQADFLLSEPPGNSLPKHIFS